MAIIKYSTENAPYNHLLQLPLSVIGLLIPYIV